MKLLSLFLIRLRRYRIPIVLPLVILALVLALNLRNRFQYEQLRLQDRHLVISLKKEAESFLYDKESESLDQEVQAYYENVLGLSNTYLEQEYLQGKGSSLIQTELQLYQLLVDWSTKGHNLNHYSDHELGDRLGHLTNLVHQNLSFNYWLAPKDFFLVLHQILSFTSLLIPGLVTVVCLCLALSDRSNHYGFLVTNGIVAKSYSSSLTLLGFCMSIACYVILLMSQTLVANYFDFSFQATYPILDRGNSHFIPVWEGIQDLLRHHLLTTFLGLLLIKLGSFLIFKWRSRLYLNPFRRSLNGRTFSE